MGQDLTKAPEQAPEVKLAAHLRSNLGVDVDPKHLRNYLLAHWSKVSLLAHSVHDATQPYEPYR